MSLRAILLFPLRPLRAVLAAFHLLAESGDSLAQENGDLLLLD